MKILYQLWFFLTRVLLHKRYFFHLFRKDGVVQLRTGCKYGQGDLLDEAQEEVRGLIVPELISRNADKIGNRLHTWSSISEKKNVLNSRLFAYELEFGAKTARIGDIWTQRSEAYPNGEVYIPEVDFQVLEPVNCFWGPMIVYKNLTTGEIVKGRMMWLWRHCYKQKE